MSYNTLQIAYGLGGRLKMNSGGYPFP